MLSFFAAALLEAASAQSPGWHPDRQARAAVTILRAEPIRFGQATPPEGSIVRQSTAREPDGLRRPSTLIEFY